jgi:hypothetical protein
MWQESTEIALGAIETIAVPLTLPDWDSNLNSIFKIQILISQKR